MLSRSVRILAPAKVNLFLGVHSELDERRYHLVDSLMACVDVADVVTLQDSGELTVRCEPDLGIPQEKNTCWKAARAMGDAFGRDPQFEIVVEKHVPDQAGLGGGSSDAAATIVGICELWGIDPQDPRCFAAARSVGADVAFFLSGLPTFLQGAGDLVPIPGKVHAGDGGRILRAVADQGPCGLPDGAVVGQIHAAEGGVLFGLGFPQPLIQGGHLQFHRHRSFLSFF